MLTRPSTAGLQRAPLFVVWSRPYQRSVGVKATAGLRANLRLVSECDIDFDHCLTGGNSNNRTARNGAAGTRSTPPQLNPCACGAAPVGRRCRRALPETRKCDTCGRFYRPCNHRPNSCPRCVSYWNIEAVLMMGRANQQAALPFCASEILIRGKHLRGSHGQA